MPSNELRVNRSSRWGKTSVKKAILLQLFTHALPTYDRKNERATRAAGPHKRKSHHQRKVTNKASKVAKAAKAKKVLTTEWVKTKSKGESQCFIYKGEDHWAKDCPEQSVEQ